MIDRTSLLAGGTEIMQHRLSGSRFMCAGLVVTFIGLAIGLMATYDIPGHWTTAVVGVAVLLAARCDGCWGVERPRGARSRHAERRPLDTMTP